MTRPRVIAITDVEQASEDAHVEAYSALAGELPAGSLWIQVRDRRPAGHVIAFARRLQGEIPSIPIVVNDRLDVARALGTTRVHLGRASVSIAEARGYLGDGAWVSVAAHGIAELACLSGRADAALLSPIFASPGKGTPLGVEAIRKARDLAPDVAIFALGGVDATNARACLDAGAAGVAVIRAALDRARVVDLVRAVG